MLSLARITTVSDYHLIRISAWCHTCDELASNSCNRHVLTQLSRNDELLLSRNQMDKIKLSLSYAVSRRTEIDSYLKSIKQSFTILEKHVIQLMEDNSLQMDFIEGNSLGSKVQMSFQTVH